MNDDKLVQTAGKLLDLIKAEGIEQPEHIRMVAGLLLSSTHTAIIAMAKQGDERKAVMECVDSVHRLLKSLQAAIDEFKIEGVVLDMGFEIEDQRGLQ